MIDLEGLFDPYMWQNLDLKIWAEIGPKKLANNESIFGSLRQKAPRKIWELSKTCILGIYAHQIRTSDGKKSYHQPSKELRQV